MNKIEFFVPMDKLPTVTAQQKGCKVIGDKPKFYTKQNVRAVEKFYKFILLGHKPERPMAGAITLMIGYQFPARKPHKDGQPKTTRPDTDNLIKLVKDVMTDVGFWYDDSQVFLETYSKIYSKTPGLYFCIKEYDPKLEVSKISLELGLNIPIEKAKKTSKMVSEANNEQ